MTTPTVTVTDGTTTVTLSSGNQFIESWDTQLAKVSPLSRDPEDVSETIVLRLTSTPTNNSATIRSLNRLGLTARGFQIGVEITPVYITQQWSHDGSSWRSELKDLAVEIDKDTLDQWDRTGVGVKVTFTRRGYWEGSRTSVSLTNGNGTGTTLAISNNSGSGGAYYNYVDIGSTAISGDLMAPAEVRLQNTTGSDRGFDQFYLCADRVTTQVMYFEAEAETNSAGSPVAYADSGGGNVYSVTLTTGTPTRTLTWAMSSALLTATRGQQVHIVGYNKGTVSAGVFGRIVVRDYYNLVTLHTGSWASFSNRRDLYFGSLRLPPVSQKNTNLAQLTLNLEFQYTGSSVGFLGLDYIQLMPAHSFRRFEQRGMLVQNNDWVVDDGIERMTYLIEAGANHPIYSPRTEPLYLPPSQPQRVRFLFTRTYVTARDAYNVQVYYRPRRISL